VLKKLLELGKEGDKDGEGEEHSAGDTNGEYYQEEGEERR